MSFLLSAPMGAAYNLVIALAHALAPMTGGLATAAAIVAFTIGVRFLLTPLSLAALRGQARFATLQPRVQELQRRYARQPDRLQAELTALYRSEGGGLLAGCLPLLLQLPFFAIVYRLFLSPAVDGRPNRLLTHDLLGVPLGSHWLSGAGPASAHGLVFLVLFALLALAGLASIMVARRAAAAQPAPTAGPPVPGGQGRGLMGAVTAVLPFTTVVIAAVVPLAAGLYLLTSTGWAVAERALARRRADTRRPDRASDAAAALPAGSAP
jgi:YidC/Oxa1 family membrane protein insertase